MAKTKRAYRPPIGVPSREPRSWWEGHTASVIVHALILAFIIAPTVHSDFRGAAAIGAGGPGPAGGGGGGGSGERLQFVAVRAAPAPVAPAQPDVARVTPPVTAPPVASPPSPVTAPPTEPISGTGSGGTGGEGAGPGTGGGVGSGIGTGRGSGVGPGTGGGTAEQHPPTVMEMWLPPLPAPDRIKPYHLIAWFDVDERGNAKLLGFNPSRDNGYNRRLRDVLVQLRFRPAVRADGTPVRDTVDIHYIF